MGRIHGKFLNGKEEHEIDLPIIIFEDQGLWFYYAPALDLTGYGKTPEEAENSLQLSMTELFKYSINKGTTKKMLIDLGWTFKKWNRNNKLILAPSLHTLLMRDSFLREVFDEKVFTKTSKKFNFPLVA